MWRHWHVLPVVLVGAAVLSAALPASAGNVYVQGLVPNWEQPYDYPDPPGYDAGGPGPRPLVPPRPWDAWCTPTASAMLMGHWADVLGVANTGDAFADGNQGKIPPGYLGTAWGAGPDWHDYCADGTNARPAPGPYPFPAPPTITDLGWYLNTNNLGAGNLLTNPGVPHAGTFVGNTDQGINNFLADRAAPPALVANTTYVGLGAGQTPLALVLAMIQGEIDANRTVLGHFKWWVNPQVPGPGNGIGGENSEDDFEASGGFALYEFDTTNPGGGPNGEEWNGQDGAECLGHTVTLVGYTTNAAGALTHLIAHDNWPTTVRNVQVPIVLPGGAGPLPLTAITTVVPEPATVGLLLLGGAGVLARRRRRAGRV